jgi:hypothetical protein
MENYVDKFRLEAQDPVKLKAHPCTVLFYFLLFIYFFNMFTREKGIENLN